MSINLKCLRCGGPAVRLIQNGELSCARQCAETAVSMAKRIVLQEVVARLAPTLKDALPDGVGFTLVLFNYGEDGGNMAYVSTAAREGAVSLLQELLDKMRSEPIAEGARQ